MARRRVRTIDERVKADLRLVDDHLRRAEGLLGLSTRVVKDDPAARVTPEDLRRAAAKIGPPPPFGRA